MKNNPKQSGRAYDAEAQNEIRELLEFADDPGINQLSDAEIERDLVGWALGKNVSLKKRGVKNMLEEIEKDPEFRECASRVSTIFALLKQVIENGSENLAFDLGFPRPVLIAYLQAIFGGISIDLNEPGGITSLINRTIEKNDKFSEVLYKLLGLKKGTAPEEIRRNVEILKNGVFRLRRLMELSDFQQIHRILKKTAARKKAVGEVRQSEWRAFIAEQGYSTIPVAIRTEPIQPDADPEEAGRSVYKDIEEIGKMIRGNHAHWLGNEETETIELSEPSSANPAHVSPPSAPVAPKNTGDPGKTVAYTGGDKPTDFVDDSTVWEAIEKLQTLFNGSKTWDVGDRNRLRLQINNIKELQQTGKFLGDAFVFGEADSALAAIREHFGLKSDQELSVMIFEALRQFTAAGIVQ